MDFEFTEEQHALRENARSVLESACPPSLVRSVHEGTGDGSKLWNQLVELHWPALGIPEELDGLGLTAVEVGIVVEELGRAVAPTPFLATVTQFAPLVSEAGATGLLADVATGASTGTLAIAEDGVWRRDALQTTARRDGEDWVLDGTKTHVIDGASADRLAVVARVDGSWGSDGIGAFVVPAADVKTESHTLIDPTLPVASVVLNGVRVSKDAVLFEPGDPTALTAIERGMQEATTALALSTIATCRRIFEVTLQYTKDREQFGRPIGSFQAIKHRLADMYLEVEKASSLAYFAALTIAEDDDRRAVAASMAKSAAGDCQRRVVRDGLQLHGGIGFTWENDLHLWLKRAITGELLFGTSTFHRAQLAPLLGIEAS